MRLFAYVFVILAAFFAPAAAQVANVAEPAPTEAGSEPQQAAGATPPAGASTEAPANANNPPALKPLPPTLFAAIDLSKQRMVVTADGEVLHSWPISSGREGYLTPTGTYRPHWLTRMHYSKKYDNAPMPYSVFFHGGYAIHATYATRALGQPASHGCIRLALAHAKAFYALVEKHGKGRTRIAVTGLAPMAVAKRAPKTQAASVEGSDAPPKPRRRKAAAPLGYSVQPRQLVWPGDPAPRGYYRPRYGSASYTGTYGNYRN